MTSSRADGIKFAVGSLALLFVVVATGFPEAAIKVLGIQPYNIAMSVLVLVHGLVLLRYMWQIEMVGGGATIPFGWTFFATQHMTFGLGGVLTSLADAGYFYENDQGIFPWSDAIPLMLLVHMASMSVGLLGIAVATRTREDRQDIFPGFRRNIWLWRDSEVIAYVCLAIHALVWVVFASLKISGFITYVVLAIQYCTNAAFVLWGLGWGQCGFRARVVFATYSTAFIVLELLEGNRTYFLVPAILFAIGYLISPLRPRINMRMVAVGLPLAMLLGWGVVKSEDVRSVFTRGSVQDLGDTLQRVESLNQDSERDLVDATGEKLSGTFRLGSRLFELSAGDTITRTPTEVPYWGWTPEDTDILVSSALPLGLNSDAAVFQSDNAGVLYLRSYGWDIDPLNGGTSMPATMIGDAWRRFGWFGVGVTYLAWSMLMARASLWLRFRTGQTIMAVFACSLLSNTIMQYASDVTTLFSQIPRRLLVIAVYTGIVMLGRMFFEARRTTDRSGTLTPVALR